MRGSWRLNKDCNILTSPAPPDIAVCLSRSPGLLNRRPGAQLSAESWFSLLDPEHCFKTLISNCNCSIGELRSPSAGCWFSLSHLISNWLTSCLHPGYIIVRHHLLLVSVTNRTQFNPSTVKVISWYSSTGCTCYLHRCISYFDSLAGLEVNMQQMYT